MELGLSGKRVFITASSGGIGLAVADRFLQEGARVLLNGRNEGKLDQIVDRFRKKYGEGKVQGYSGDVTETQVLSGCKAFLDSIWEGVDILVANLGMGKPLGSDKLAADEWEKMFQVNLFSAVELVRVFQDMLAEAENASILFISSIVAYERMSAPYAYGAAKSGICTLSKYLSGDLAENGIRVNTVVPGNVYFPGGRWEELSSADPEGVEAYIRQNVPMKRFGTPEEIADAVLFLSSERASFITGAELVVDGGQKRS